VGRSEILFLLVSYLGQDEDLVPEKRGKDHSDLRIHLPNGVFSIGDLLASIFHDSEIRMLTG
jgi:hypothetical protein